MPARRVAILGMGLIGSSVARAVRACHPNWRIAALDADEATLQAAQEMQLADFTTTDAAEAVRDADFVVLAVPVAALVPVARAMAAGLKEGVLVTDVASVKRVLLEEVAPLLPAGAVVPAHPIAGSEKSGIHAGSATLFAGKPVILTPENPEAPGVEAVAQFWKSLHADIHYMPADMHDRIYGCLSHVPQYLSFVISELYIELDVPREGGPGGDIFRRFRRLECSDAGLWKEIFDANSDNINNCLDHFLHVLHQVRQELREGEEGSASGTDDALVRTVLFPRIVASCMIHVAHLLERELRIPIKPYAGNGFRDFTAPAAHAPEEDLETISGHAHAVADLLDDLALRVRKAMSDER